LRFPSILSCASAVFNWEQAETTATKCDAVDRLQSHHPFVMGSESHQANPSRCVQMASKLITLATSSSNPKTPGPKQTL